MKAENGKRKAEIFQRFARRALTLISAFSFQLSAFLLCFQLSAFAATESVVVDSSTRAVKNTGAINYATGQLKVNGTAVVPGGGGDGDVSSDETSVTDGDPIVFSGTDGKTIRAAEASEILQYDDPGYDFLLGYDSGTGTLRYRYSNDGTMANNDPLRIPSEAAVRSYVLAHEFGGGWTDLDFTASDLADLEARNFADLQNKPTTVAGYGITNAVTLTGDQTIAGTKTFSSGTSTASYLKIGVSEANDDYRSVIAAPRSENAWPPVNTSDAAEGSIWFAIGNIPAFTIDAGQNNIMELISDSSVNIISGGYVDVTSTLGVRMLSDTGFLSFTANGKVNTRNALGASAGVWPASVGGTGISSLGTGIATALGVNIGSAGAPVLFNGAGGTPSSLTLTNATGLPVSGITASTSTALGVGSIELGHATDTTLARLGAGSLGVEGVAVPTVSSTSTLTNKRITKRVVSVSDATSITPDSDASDLVTQANTQAAGTLTINAPTGTPTDGQGIALRIKCTNAQTLSWNVIYRAGADLSLPTATTGSSKTGYYTFYYNATDTKWDLAGASLGY